MAITSADLRQLAEAVPAAQARRDKGIADAARQGMPQTDIADATKLKREQVRRICRAQGVEGRPGPTPKQSEQPPG